MTSERTLILPDQALALQLVILPRPKLLEKSFENIAAQMIHYMCESISEALAMGYVRNCLECISTNYLGFTCSLAALSSQILAT